MTEVARGAGPRWWPAGGLWRHPDFLRLWGAQAASAFGSRITRTALPILAIVTLRATPGELALLSALGVAPSVVVGLLVGGRVDRSAKRPLLIGADLVRAALVATIPLAAWLGVLSMPQLYGVAAAVGAASALFAIADNSFLPVLVAPERLVEGNARLEATESVAEAAGPGLAGIMVQALTAPVAIAIDALSYVWSAALLSRIRTRESPGSPGGASTLREMPHGVLRDVRVGFRACLAHPVLGPTLIADALVYLFGGVFLALYMLLTLRTLGLSPAVVGLVIGVGGVGAFAGALLAPALGRRLGTGAAMVLALAVGQGAVLLIPLAVHVPALAVPLLTLQQLVGDAFLAAYAVHAVSLRQRVLPAELLGRASAAVHATTGGALALGALAAGPVAAALGVTGTAWIGACGGLLAVALLLASPVRRVR
jgi:predicted MFS family arabinose efflux permease